jgi:hypothetical protein
VRMRVCVRVRAGACRVGVGRMGGWVCNIELINSHKIFATNFSPLNDDETHGLSLITIIRGSE